MYLHEKDIKRAMDTENRLQYLKLDNHDYGYAHNS